MASMSIVSVNCWLRSVTVRYVTNITAAVNGYLWIKTKKFDW
ncbi:MAG: hypothetical protein OFPII_25330 [Osedax symbiont Rs1]|nr:MAG: hypothetical protein OFPII_25330 [Osedax symbiont Rs1]